MSSACFLLQSSIAVSISASHWSLVWNTFYVTSTNPVWKNKLSAVRYWNDFAIALNELCDLWVAGNWLCELRVQRKLLSHVCPETNIIPCLIKSKYIYKYICWIVYSYRVNCVGFSWNEQQRCVCLFPAKVWNVRYKICSKRRGFCPCTFYISHCVWSYRAGTRVFKMFPSKSQLI